jgi:hypothetical protein
MARKRRSPDARRQFLVERPTPYNPTVRPKGTDTVPWGRAWTLADGDKRVVVEVEANAAALDAYAAGTLPQTGRLAIQTEGKSAIESHLGDRTLPTHILITAAGVRIAK